MVDLQLHQNQMKSLSHSPLKTEKANCIQIILEQQAPGRRKGKENICNAEANSGVKLSVAVATPCVTKGKWQHWKKQILPP